MRTRQRRHCHECALLRDVMLCKNVDKLKLLFYYSAAT